MKTRYYYFRTAYSLSYAITNRKFASSSDEAWERLRDEYSQDNPSRQYIPEAEGVIEALPEDLAILIEKFLHNNRESDFSGYSFSELTEMAKRRTGYISKSQLRDGDIIKLYRGGFAVYKDGDLYNYNEISQIDESDISFESWQIIGYDEETGWEE